MSNLTLTQTYLRFSLKVGRGRLTWDARTRGRQDVGCGDAGKSRREDVINKEHLNFALNL